MAKATNEQVAELAGKFKGGRYVTSATEVKEGWQLKGLQPLFGIVPERSSIDKAYLQRMLPPSVTIKNFNYIDNEGSIILLVDATGSEYTINIFQEIVTQQTQDYIGGDVVLMYNE